MTLMTIYRSTQGLYKKKKEKAKEEKENKKKETN